MLQRFGIARGADVAGELDARPVRADVQVSADPRADSDRKDVRTLLFESVRELLFNAVKHAQADRVTLRSGARSPTISCASP